MKALVMKIVAGLSTHLKDYLGVRGVLRKIVNIEFPDKVNRATIHEPSTVGTYQPQGIREA